MIQQTVHTAGVVSRFAPYLAPLSLAVTLGLAAMPAAAQGAAGQAQAATESAGALGGPDGEQLYRQNCMACHMAQGEGAQGLGRFPALANNPALTAAGYPIFVVLNGLGGMPWFNGMLSDEEIAAVVSYVRTHFGNTYTDPVRPEDVAMMRGPVPTE